MSCFDRWYGSVVTLLAKYGVDTTDLDEAYWRDAYRDGKNPEEAVMEDLCLSV